MSPRGYQVSAFQFRTDREDDVGAARGGSEKRIVDDNVIEFRQGTGVGTRVGDAVDQVAGDNVKFAGCGGWNE